MKALSRLTNGVILLFVVGESRLHNRLQFNGRGGGRGVGYGIKLCGTISNCRRFSGSNQPLIAIQNQPPMTAHVHVILKLDRFSLQASRRRLIVFESRS